MALLSLKGISKSFGSVMAVDDISFSVDRGEIVGFLGPNGAGKSTTMRIINQFFEPDAGDIRLEGQALIEIPREAKRRIGYLPENNPLYGDMLVVDYLSFIADLRELAGSARDRAIDDAIAATGISEVYYRPIGELSKGYRQRVGLAQAILHKPDLLVLDEPTEGLDPNQREEIRKLIENLGREHSVILSTHVLPEAQNTCSRLLMINEGKIVADGPVDQLMVQARGNVPIIVEASGSNIPEELGRLHGVISVNETPSDNAGVISVTLSADPSVDVRPKVFELAKSQGWTLYELHQEPPTVGDIFQELTTTSESESE
ncbi:MAG: ATP-binding cassette domain-containing protein [Gemmatimonadota bacterium]|nr:MAG: ATP-binding cassette domain-containing protein [Gemmatimonadota bacterium]